MRWIGLDIGDKTIGVAVSDPLFISAQGVTTIERVGIKKDTTKVMEYIKEYEADTVVCGLPLMLDGSDSPQTEKVREFAERLKNKTQSNGLKLNYVFQDERFTTKIAENVLIEANMRREKRKTIIDRQAAVIILQSYMDAQRRN
ncbi:MAG: Holliday junction resolvase RuvX [Firmicutes bacterium]|nr:Holliday junction resolvase RuvX [Bacillota bacterium]MBQ3931868.1 Holliday junction resolvase RuvX [Bacillota bacterium]